MIEGCLCVKCVHLGCIDKYKDKRIDELQKRNKIVNLEQIELKRKYKKSMKIKDQQKMRIKTLENKVA